VKHLPPTRRIDIDGHDLAYTIAGQGQPAIVLINGAGGPLEGWFRLYPAIAELGTVVSYDRPGAGASGPPRVPHTGDAAVCMLRRLLEAIAVPGPYVLVAHSFGGLHANLFARRYPRDVAGVVFLEATAPADVGAMSQHQTVPQRFINRLLGLVARPDPNGELTHERLTVEQIEAAPPFPDVPVKVVSGGKTLPGWMASRAARELRTAHQQELARLSPRGERIVATRSGHFPQMSEPALVVDIVKQMVAEVLGTRHAGSEGVSSAN
jgi:pimeloyl-ACP methyl ester carboxylesterase